MTTVEKLEAINRACNGTISITSYGDSVWQINSYEDDTPLNSKNLYPYIRSEKFDLMVDEAYNFVFHIYKKEAK